MAKEYVNKKHSRESAPSHRRPAAGEVTIVDEQNPEVLLSFVTEQGKILPERLTNLSARQQRELKRAIRRQRTLGTML